MTLPTSYLTSTKNLDDILKAMQSAQAPQRFTQKFLESLGYPSSTDRAVINVLKSLGMLDDSGTPIGRYHRFLDQTQSATVLAEGIREAYSDLFQINTSANTMSSNEVKNKMKTLSEGSYTEGVLQKMATTFVALCKIADFSQVTPVPAPAPAQTSPTPTIETRGPIADHTPNSPFGALQYNINIHLPESRDPAVYEALFRALREHLQ
jgi:hypothetical protein